MALKEGMVILIVQRSPPGTIVHSQDQRMPRRYGANGSGSREQSHSPPAYDKLYGERRS
jgi:hypothetical protein